MESAQAAGAEELQETSTSSTTTSPRSHLVVTLPELTRPLLPTRSPLRPPPRSISSSDSPTTALESPSPNTPSDDDHNDQTLTKHSFAAQQMSIMRDRHNSYPSINGLIDALSAEINGMRLEREETEPDESPNRLSLGPVGKNLDLSLSLSLEKSLPPKPEIDSPLSIDLEEDLLLSSEGTTSSEASSTSRHSNLNVVNPNLNFRTSSGSESTPSTSTSNSTLATSISSVSGPPPMTKRQHALHELLSSERAYASDLALLREVHIPLALGHSAPIHVPTTSHSSHPNANTDTDNSNSNAASGSGSSSAFASGSRSDSPSRAVSTSSTSSDPSSSTAAGGPTASSSIPVANAYGSASIFQAQRISISSSTSSSISNVSFSSAGHGSTNSTGGSGFASPMTPEDVKVIFGNISELAMLSDELCDELERALGNNLDGGIGNDYVGELFLRVVPEFEKPYKQYITRHSTALQHLQNLPQTPSLQAYLAYTQSVASSVSHAWDLASLLIKPVQRLLKYPLLLNAILEETPDEHSDKENLKLARQRIEELARDVNEGRRRAEVVKDVLSNGGGGGILGGLKSPGRKASASGAGSLNHPVGVAASVNLTKVKSLKYGGITAATMRAENASVLALDATNPSASTLGLGGSNAEAALVGNLANELKRTEEFAQQFAKNVVDWGKMMSKVMVALRAWALSFGRVIGLADGLGSEAFDAFLDMVRRGLMPLTADLELALNERILKDLAHLLITMNKPLKLLASMSEQEPYHYYLLTMLVSPKNRPPPSLLAASTNYLALRGQLATDLPTYIRLLDQGMAVIVRRLAEVQVRFWKDVKERWAELWEMLKVENELNVGSEETCSVWRARWGDVDEIVTALGIMQKPVAFVEKVRVMHQQQQHQLQQQQLQLALQEHFSYPGYAPMGMGGYPVIPTTPKEKEHHKLEKKSSKSSSSSSNKHSASPASSTWGSTTNVATVQSMFAALEPAHSPAHQRNLKQQQSQQVVGGHNNTSVFSVSAPLPLGSVHRDRDRDRDGKELKRVRSRVESNATTSSAGVKDKRTSSQDSAHSRQPRSSASREALQRRRTQGHIGMAEDYAEYVALHGGVMPPPYEGGNYPYGNGKAITRMKSMPLAGNDRDRGTRGNSTNGNSGFSGDVERRYYQEGWEDYQEGPHSSSPRGRSMHEQHVLVKPSPSTKQKSHERKRSGSVKSITSFFTGSSTTINTTNTAVPVDPQPLTPSQRDSWVSKPAKYICQVIHPCRPPASVSYYSFPFFTLKEGDLFEVLQEAGHPSIHPKLPLYVDDGEDCLLLCRDGNGVVGWALASFLEPLNFHI